MEKLRGDSSAIPNCPLYERFHMDNEFVPRFYVMNPEDDDLLRTGQLKKNMVVLCENPGERLDMTKQNSWDAEDRLHAATYNRWCLVTEDPQEFDPNHFSFIGLYADGFKTLRSYGPNIAWYVKKHSMTKEPVFAQEDSEPENKSVWRQLDDAGE